MDENNNYGIANQLGQPWDPKVLEPINRSFDLQSQPL